jgi:hypothetical protein
MTYQCPVCGFDAMPLPPGDHTVCSCCGTEFGYHDLHRSHEDLRKDWIDRGSPWFSQRMPKPQDWDPQKQLAKLREAQVS